MFRSYRRDGGIEALLSELDLSVLTRQQVYGAVLGRWPESTERTRLPGAAYDSKQHFKQALNSLEFQRRIVRLVSDAYQEKSRIVFLHVPKCAGTDFRFNLAQRYPLIEVSLALEDHTGK